MHFSLKIWHLVASNILIVLRINSSSRKLILCEHENSVFVKLLVRQPPGLPDLFLRPCVVCTCSDAPLLWALGSFMWLTEYILTYLLAWYRAVSALLLIYEFVCRCAVDWVRVDVSVRRRLWRVSALRGPSSTAADVHLLADWRQRHGRHGRRVGRKLLEHWHGGLSQGVLDQWRNYERRSEAIASGRQAAGGARGRLWSTDCLLCTTEFSRISKERKKLRTIKMTGTLCIYIHLDIGSV